MTIKPLALVVTAFLSTSSLFAQTEIPFKSGKKNVTVEATLNLITGSSAISFGASDLRIRYFLSDQIALRTRLNYSSTSFTNNYYSFNYTDPAGKSVEDQNSMGIAVGAEYHFAGTPKLSPYAGAEFGFNSVSGNITGTNYDGRQYSIGDNYEGSISGGGGFTAGLVAGADYYIVHGIYIGGEIGYGYSYLFDGYLNSSLNGVKAVEKELSTTTGFGLATNAGIRIGVRF